MLTRDKFNAMRLWRLIIFVLIILSILVGLTWETEPREPKPIKHSVVKAWADKLGIELWHLGNFITRRKEVQDSFKTAQVVPRDGKKILENMVMEIESMFKSKISAVQRIMDAAENAAQSHDKDACNEQFSYYDAKEMLEPLDPTTTIAPKKFDDRSLDPPNVTIPRIRLHKNRNFYNIPVNTSLSSVHVPTNVYGRACDVIKDIEWSNKLDRIFKDNYQKDPTLSFQFFGSSTGFMRQFPASKWKQDPVDLFDCRLRPWYIEAAASPKDMVILVDISGSMRGQRKDIAKHVVSNILETLTTNDFVNILKFSERIESVVKCFNESLVPATLDNIRSLNTGMETIETEKIANYSQALISAFEILQSYRMNDEGAGCNQAIMLISDGVPHDFNETFQRYNWPNETYRPVRLFTYLIGSEVPDFQLIKEMACINQGYYVHLSVPSEVREQVLRYIPVMARPLVLGRQEHPIIWSHVYADIIDPKMTDYKWEIKQRRKQKDLFLNYRNVQTGDGNATFDDRLYKPSKNEDETTTEEYNMLTTVSIPVYDRRESANITEEILINEAHWISITREMAIANLLGVAGTDVPIRDIKKLMMPFTLGVNGYAFIVNNNGYVLTHPDLRPSFQGILKPAYNTIDMLEVELLDDAREPRDFSDSLLKVREQIINQENGTAHMMVKYHLDNMKRVSRLKRNYYWTAIPQSPFTLVLTIPEPYGLNRLQIRYEDEIHRVHAKGNDVLSFFEGHRWRVHPDWLYCKHAELQFETPEEELKYFLNKTKNSRWKWKGRTAVSPEHAVHSNTSTGRTSTINDKDSYYCDRSLMQEVVFDAKVTEWFSRNDSFNTKDGNEFDQRFGITTAFLATHSGLTRWMDFQKPNNNYVADSHPEEPSVSNFIREHHRSVDEVWYKRAVEQHYVEPQSFVYSVPFNQEDTTIDVNNILVTASHAIFHTEDKKSAPIAVVGYQFQHSALQTLFKNITTNCGENCAKTCFSRDPDIECFILDNHGYVIVTKEPDNTGKFFGEIDGKLMQSLVIENIYEEVNITDYQGVCYMSINDGNPANILQTPFLYMIKLIKWTIKLIAWAIVQTSILPVDANDALGMDYENADYPSSTMLPFQLNGEEKIKTLNKSAIINRTRLYSCDQTIKLYTLSPSLRNRSTNRAPSCERPFVVMPIPNSNLILLVKDLNCPVVGDMYNKMTVEAEEYKYVTRNSCDAMPCLTCFKATRQLFRRRPASCISQNKNESEIQQCGHGNTISISLIFIALVIFIGQIL
ncbi:voltage-dependent calcium channel subunit alpha-2/delta-3 isoform X3 [Sitodiplosis mosellana]|uniref:voltage-dependent calcium channel subunit alpha-2/delta-3 isoform X3 n=1 Tax=Sitodiplosis mosellana TaxID=263140 RepID=UPI0024440736|nr:voltage-dependent calcium channel subunit alpha-2/delta-3 isoform X3 [Sitodiplosis mosellana]